MRDKWMSCLVGCLVVSAVVADSWYKEHYITKYCQPDTRHETIEMDDNEAIIIRSGDNYKNFLECSVSVKADKGYGIVVTVRKVNLRDTTDTLTVDLSDTKHPEWTGAKVIDNKETTSYVGDRKIKIIFSTGYSPKPTNHKEWILILTSYRQDTYCRQSEISCGQNRCLSQNFLCDGHNNCGDNSDEILCMDFQQTSNLAIVGSAMAGLVVVLLICYCCRCCTCCCRSKKPRKDYIPFSDGTDSSKLETTFITNEPLEPTAPIGANDHFNYGTTPSTSQFARFPVNPNYPYCLDTNPRPGSSQVHNYPPPPPYTPREEPTQ